VSRIVNDDDDHADTAGASRGFSGGDNRPRR
jgi:hypothetical protein